MVARQATRVHGTRYAGKNVEPSYTQAFKTMDFVTSASYPCVFHRVAKHISPAARGETYIALGTDDTLDWYDAKIIDSFGSTI